MPGNIKYTWLVMVAALAGCAVGPDYEQPEALKVERFTEQEIAGQLPLSTEQKIPASWWELFQSDALNAIIKQAIANNQTIAAAEARLMEAQENLAASKSAAFFPRVDLTAGADRQKFSPAAMGLPATIPASIFNLYNTSVEVSYRLDVLGGVRRAVESREARLRYQEYERMAVYLTLSANVATSVFREAGLRAQIDAMQKIINAEDERLTIMEKQLSLGVISQSQLLTARARAEDMRSSLPALENELARVRNQLFVYLGKAPGEGGVDAFSLDTFTALQTIPISLPSEFVRQRPDILAAEAILQQTSADVGVATANLFPQLVIHGNYGPTSAALGDFLESDSMLWSFGAGVTQPLFHGGELSAKRRAAEAAHKEAQANYRQTVLQGFQNVADSLKALESNASVLKSRTDVLESTKANLDIAEKKYALGGISYLTLLETRQRYQQARLDQAGVEALQFSNIVALFQSLGGGWWNAENGAQ